MLAFVFARLPFARFPSFVAFAVARVAVVVVAAAAYVVVVLAFDL